MKEEVSIDEQRRVISLDLAIAANCAAEYDEFGKCSRNIDNLIEATKKIEAYLKG